MDLETSNVLNCAGNNTNSKRYPKNLQLTICCTLMDVHMNSKFLFHLSSPLAPEKDFKIATFSRLSGTLRKLTVNDKNIKIIWDNIYLYHKRGRSKSCIHFLKVTHLINFVWNTYRWNDLKRNFDVTLTPPSKRGRWILS